MEKYLNKKFIIKFLDSNKHLILILLFGLILLNMFVYKENFESGDSANDDSANVDSANVDSANVQTDFDGILEKCPQCPVCRDDELNSQINELKNNLSNEENKSENLKNENIEKINKLTNIKNKLDQLKGINNILRRKNGFGDGDERINKLNNADIIFAEINGIYS